jgi:uncharacterized small protein (DUF1192 family)
MQSTTLMPVNKQATATITSMSEQNKKISTNYFFRDTACKINIDSKYKAYLCCNDKESHIVNIPTQCGEGHLFCYQCIVVVPQPKGEAKEFCPECYLSESQSTNNLPEESFTLHKDYCIQSIVDTISINCPTKETFNLENKQQCNWQGELKQLDSHLIKDCNIFPKAEVLQHKILQLEKQLEETIASISTTHNLTKKITLLEQEIARLKQQSFDQAQEISLLNQQIANITTNIEKIEKASSVATNNRQIQPFIWKIDHYSRRLHNEKQGIKMATISPSFYPKQGGYNFAAKVYLNGDGLGKYTHMSVFIVVKKGEYDNILKWPLANAKITVTLINQDGKNNWHDAWHSDVASSSFQKPIAESNIATGNPLFIDHIQLNNGGFIKDDTVFLKVKIEQK